MKLPKRKKETNFKNNKKNLTSASSSKQKPKTFHFLLLSAHFQIAHSFAWKKKDV
jgi:hypothetical protein